jgi:hypothetical protein
VVDAIARGRRPTGDGDVQRKRRLIRPDEATSGCRSMRASVSSTDVTQSLGAYGFRLSGLDAAAELLARADPDWPALELLALTDDPPPPPHDRVTEDRAELILRSGGWVDLDRVASQATYHLQQPVRDGDLLHPYLAPVAALAARWLGRESFHAGAVVVDGGAWALLGDKEAGKSSTLAQLALSGHTVLTDDVLVVRDGAAFAGPRCIDLRAEPARRLGAGVPLGVVGMRERFRLELGPAPAEVPLRGFITLGWAEELTVERLRGSQRLLTLIPHRALLLESSAPADLLELSSLPFVEIRRPRGWGTLEETTERLMAELAG